MAFDRKEFYGHTFNWYMLDSVGSVAMFMSGYGPIPKAVFSDEEKYNEVLDFFANLTVLSNDYLLPGGQIRAAGDDDIFFEVKAAKRGLFVFDNREYTDNYDLSTIPVQKVTLRDLPQQIQERLKTFSFEGIQFRDTNRICITRHFECE